MRRRYVLTNLCEETSYQECKAAFRLYGIEVERYDFGKLPDLNKLRDPVSEKKLIAYLKFTTDYIPLRPGYPVYSLTSVTKKITLEAFTSKGISIYENDVEGYCKETAVSDPKERWEELFIPKMLIFEVNSEENPFATLISQYIKEHVYYSTPINLSYNPLNQSRTIDFTQDPARFIMHEPLYNNFWAKKIGSHKIFIESVNRGVFFRSPKNRREKNYWLPGLNAGIPLTPKKDEVHERSFMAHDFGHFIIPDLIIAEASSKALRKLYIVHRMMSEAFTLVMTDMVFVDTLFRSGMEYDYTKRKIYPLFKDLEIDLSDKNQFRNNMKTLLKANVAYCLRGDCSLYRSILDAKGKSYDHLDHFKRKYMPFFVEDFRWTEQNYKHIIAHQSELNDWWKLVEPLRRHASLDLETVTEFADLIGFDESQDVIDQVFEELFERVISIYLKEEIRIEPFEFRLKKAFYRYMMGQLALFTRYKSELPESEKIEKLMMSFLLSGESINLEFIRNCRAFYEDIVDYLLTRNMISHDDHAIFKEMFPLLEPFFVHYDEELGYYPELADESKRILNV